MKRSLENEAEKSKKSRRLAIEEATLLWIDDLGATETEIHAAAGILTSIDKSFTLVGSGRGSYCGGVSVIFHYSASKPTPLVHESKIVQFVVGLERLFP